MTAFQIPFFVGRELFPLRVVAIRRVPDKLLNHEAEAEGLRGGRDLAAVLEADVDVFNLDLDVVSDPFSEIRGPTRSFFRPGLRRLSLGTSQRGADLALQSRDLKERRGGWVSLCVWLSEAAG